MIIGIDASSLAYGTGVSNYTQNLISELINIDKQNLYKIFFSSLRKPLPEFLETLKKYKNVRIYHYRFPPIFFEIIWNNLHILPIEYFIGECQVFHTSDWTQPPSIQSKTICTIHDLTPFLFPVWHHKKVINNHKKKMSFAKKESDFFICVSNNTQQDLFSVFKSIPKEKTTVIYEAADNKFEEFGNKTNIAKNKEILKIKNKYKIKEYILSQGTREPRKNLSTLIEAFNMFCEKNPNSKLQLAITGKYGWGKDIDKNINKKIKILGYIPEKDICAIHAGAKFLVYPSLYEGFGLPILKSMKLGVPVITSDNSSLQEISQQSAILLNPLDSTEICNAIESLDKDNVLRQKLSKLGIENSEKYSWKITAEKTLEIYKKICPC